MSADDAGVALRGTDVVAYLDEGRRRPGEATHARQWSGATWWFATAEHADRFARDPEAYAPQFGGHCALAASFGSLLAADPDAWWVHDGRLYLGRDRAVRAVGKLLQRRVSRAAAAEG